MCITAFNGSKIIVWITDSNLKYPALLHIIQWNTIKWYNTLGVLLRDCVYPSDTRVCEYFMKLVIWTVLRSELNEHELPPINLFRKKDSI